MIESLETIRKWLVDAMSSSATDQTIVSRHIVAVSAAVDRATAFGIEAQNILYVVNMMYEPHTTTTTTSKLKNDFDDC